jgi:hypothetical protein
MPCSIHTKLMMSRSLHVHERNAVSRLYIRAASCIEHRFGLTATEFNT